MKRDASKVKKILILNPYLPTLGGGEKSMAMICKFFEQSFKNAQIDILVHNYNEIDVDAKQYPTIETIKNKFDVDLKRTYIRKVELLPATRKIDKYKNKRLIEDITKEYDIFINHMFLSKHIGRAKFNIYLCMFPPTRKETSGILEQVAWKILDSKFISSYNLFLANSLFTNGWLKKYWTCCDFCSDILYPPAFSKDNSYKEIDLSQKENIILGVGRFFVGGHNKKQDYLVEFFIENAQQLSDYELHLVGAVSDKPEDQDYVKMIEEKAKGFKIFLHTNVEFRELEDLYKKARIFWHATGYKEDENVNPIKMEHFGITTVEAMNHGLIPVVIAKGGQPEIVEHGVSGFLWKNKEECLTYTKQIIREEIDVKKIAHAAINRSLEFSEEEFYSKLKEVFDRSGYFDSNSEL